MLHFFSRSKLCFVFCSVSSSLKLKGSWMLYFFLPDMKGLNLKHNSWSDYNMSNLAVLCLSPAIFFTSHCTSIDYSSLITCCLSSTAPVPFKPPLVTSDPPIAAIQAMKQQSARTTACLNGTYVPYFIQSMVCTHCVQAHTSSRQRFMNSS